MKAYEDRVRRSIVWRWVATAVALGALLAVGFGLGNLIVDLDEGIERTFLMYLGAMMLIIAFGAGAVVDAIAVRSWDTWIGDLGPAQTEILIAEMQIRKAALEREEVKGNGAKR